MTWQFSLLLQTVKYVTITKEIRRELQASMKTVFIICSLTVLLHCVLSQEGKLKFNCLDMVLSRVYKHTGTNGNDTKDNNVYSVVVIFIWFLTGAVLPSLDVRPSVCLFVCPSLTLMYLGHGFDYLGSKCTSNHSLCFSSVTYSRNEIKVELLFSPENMQPAVSFKR